MRVAAGALVDETGILYRSFTLTPLDPDHWWHDGDTF
jgi:hypothetical protein